jgi:multiple sugar transport system permease protein
MTSITTAQATTAAVSTAATRRRFDIVPYLFILPHFLFFVVFAAYPFFYGIYISLFNYDFVRPEQSTFVGLANYRRLFFESGTEQFQSFWNAALNNVEFMALSLPPLIIIPLILAVLLNTKTPGRNVFRAIFFSPWALSGAVVSLLGFWIFQSQGGLMNYYVEALGVESPRWLSTMPWAWYAIVITTVWWTMGFNMVILLAALQDIPGELYEASSMDGANAFQSFFGITLPMLRPVLIFVTTVTIIASFNLFIQPFMMTNGGGPAQATGGGATEPIIIRLYTEGFVRSRQGSAAAMSMIVALMMMAFSYLNFRIFRTRE